MRQSLPQFSVNENLPECPACGATTVFAHAADFARNGRVYMIFTCTACGAGETKVWRPEWQAFADALTVDEE